MAGCCGCLRGLTAAAAGGKAAELTSGSVGPRCGGCKQEVGSSRPQDSVLLQLPSVR